MLKVERSMHVGRSRRMHARPWTYDIAIADTPCCWRSVDQVVSGCRRRRRLRQRGTPGTCHDVQSASWYTICVGCAGVPAANAADAGPESHGLALEAQE